MEVVNFETRIKALRLKAVPKGTSFKALKETKDSKILKKQRIAYDISEKLERPDSFKFFLKCAWHLSEDTIWDIVDRAKHNPKIKQPSYWAIAALKSELDSEI